MMSREKALESLKYATDRSLGSSLRLSHAEDAYNLLRTEQPRPDVVTAARKLASLARSVRAEIRDGWLGSTFEHTAHEIEAALASEPVFEVRWTCGEGNDTFKSKLGAKNSAAIDGIDQKTVRRAFIEPLPHHSPDTLEEAAERVSKLWNTGWIASMEDEASQALDALDKALAAKRRNPND